MTPTKLTRPILLLCVLLLLALPALAADDGTEEQKAEQQGYDQAAMMEAFQKAMTPGKNHEYLAGFEGEWTFTNTMWMDPSAPPQKSGGSAKKVMIMGGRYLQEEHEGEYDGMPFHGRGLTGYDNVGGQIVGTWIDSMATGIATSHGQRDAHGHTMHGEFADPMSGQMMKVRMVIKIVDKDHHVFEYYGTMPGMEEMKQMVIEYARKTSE